MHYVSTLELFLLSVGGIFVTDHISLYKLDLSYLCIIITNNYCMCPIFETHLLCLLLYNDKFYIRSDGSPEY